MTSTIRFCDYCEESVDGNDRFCRQCGSVLTPNSYKSVEPVNSIHWWEWIIGFDGRINRIGMIERAFILGFLEIATIGLWAIHDGGSMTFIVLLALVASLVLAIPMYYCGAVRRFHDRGKSGWSVLLLMIPIWNLVVTFELFFLPGDQTSNEFGAPPVGGYYYD